MFVCFQLLDETMKLLNSGRTCLAFPKKKSIEDLVRLTSMVGCYKYSSVLK